MKACYILHQKNRHCHIHSQSPTWNPSGYIWRCLCSKYLGWQHYCLVRTALCVTFGVITIRCFNMRCGSTTHLVWFLSCSKDPWCRAGGFWATLYGSVNCYGCMRSWWSKIQNYASRQVKDWWRQYFLIRDPVMLETYQIARRSRDITLAWSTILIWWNSMKPCNVFPLEQRIWNIHMYRRLLRLMIRNQMLHKISNLTSSRDNSIVPRTCVVAMVPNTRRP